MDLQSKKMAVLEQLKKSLYPMSLKELLQNLGDAYAERSVRRWLVEMLQEGLVEKLGNNRGSKYKFLQSIKETRVETPSYFRTESQKNIIKIRKPIYERDPITYQEDWVKSYQPNQDFYIPQEFRLQLHKTGTRSKKEDPAGTYAHQIFNRLLIDLSYNSSRLEGNTYSLADTQKLLLEGTSAEGKLDEEKIMILNHKEAIRYLVDQAPHLKINSQTIYTLHYLLSDGLQESRHTGKVRDHGVRIGGSSYIPLEDPKQLQARLDFVINKASLIQDPYEQSIFLLIHISYLQAFADVNKRTARLSANIPLIKQNFVPLSFNDVAREDYTSAIISIYELQDVNPIVDVYMFSYMRTCALYDETVKALGFDEIRVRFRKQRRALIREIIVKLITGENLEKYILQEAPKIVPSEALKDFIGDIKEDIQELSSSRIAGLGITVEQMQAWISSQERSIRPSKTKEALPRISIVGPFEES